jgi:exonuclease III
MRLSTWNQARGAFAPKLDHLFRLSPDVAAIQETPKPSPQDPLQRLWHGENPYQGLCVKAFNGYAVHRVPRVSTTAKLFLPALVRGPVDFHVLAVWVKPGTRAPQYVTPLLQGVRAYARFLQAGDTVLLGDLNTGRFLSSGDAHMKFVQLLADEFGLVSAYHAYFGVEHGYERHPTYYHRSTNGKPFHIDYCFIPQKWLPRLRSVTVGTRRRWTPLSDHVPIIVDVAL